MSFERGAEQLLIRLKLADPAARVYGVTQARGDEICGRVAAALAKAVRDSGGAARLMSTGDLTPGAGGIGDMQAVRADLRDATGQTVVAVGDLLESARGLTVAAASDLVVLVARRRRTRRADVEEARRVLEAAGARLAAAVLVE